MDPPAQRAPAGAAALLHHLPELQHGDAQDPVLAGKAVVLQADLQLVGIRPVLIAQDAAGEKAREGQPSDSRRAGEAAGLCPSEQSLWLGPSSPGRRPPASLGGDASFNMTAEGKSFRKT